MMRKLTLALALGALAFSPGAAMAWGGTAHEVIDRAALVAES